MDNPLSAARRVLSIPELLEQIILCLLQDLLPPTNRDDAYSERTIHNSQILLGLLRCSELSSHWHRCVFHGPDKLQKALFLRPESEDQRSWQQANVLYANQQSYYRGLALKAAVLNPVIQVTCSNYHFRYWRSGLGAEGPRYHAYMIITRRTLAHAREQILKDLGGTIRKMFLAQPPPTELIVSVWERNYQVKAFHNRTTSITNASIQRNEGVTLNLVLQRVGCMFDEHEDLISIKVTTV